MLEINNCFVVVIDVAGNLAKVVADSELANENIRKLIQGSLEFDLPVFLAVQSPEKIGHTIETTRALIPAHHEYARETFSVWGDDNLKRDILKTGRKQALLCGFETHICLYQSAIDLLENGFDVWMVADAISSRNLINKEIALNELRGEGVHLTSVEMVLFAFLRGSQNPSFKSISRLIR